MVTFDEYVKDVLKQIVESQLTLSQLKDKPGDLIIINKEWLRIVGLIQALINKIESSQKKSDVYVDLLKRLYYYSENYDFQREIEIMSPLYSEDGDRLKNIRWKILESFNDKKLIEKIKSLIDYL